MNNKLNISNTMKNVYIDQLGQLNLKNNLTAQKLRTIVNAESFDIFAFKSCGGSCGDSNCS